MSVRLKTWFWSLATFVIVMGIYAGGYYLLSSPHRFLGPILAAVGMGFISLVVSLITSEITYNYPTGTSAGLGMAFFLIVVIVITTMIGICAVLVGILYNVTHLVLLIVVCVFALEAAAHTYMSGSNTSD